MRVSIEDAMAGSHQVASPGVLVLAPRLDLCLDYANTLFWRGSIGQESLHSFPDLVGWCIANGVLPERAAGEFRALPQSHRALAATLFSEAIAIREAIYRIFYSTASGVSPATSDLLTVNAALKDAPARTRVEKTARGFGWRVERSKPTVAALLAPVLWSAADLLVGPTLARVRHCANEGCRWLFLDGSKNGTRRWCSMQACGNRAKAHRHYLRQKHK